MVTEGNQTLGEEYTMQYRKDILQNCALTTYIMFLTNVNQIQLSKDSVLEKVDIQINRTKYNRNPEIESHKCIQLIFDKGAKVIKQKKDDISSNGAGNIGHPYAEEQTSSNTVPYVEINSR